MERTIYFTQPELSVTMTGGFAALTPMIISINQVTGVTRIILWVTLLVLLALFITLAIILGRRRSALEISADCIRQGKRRWEAHQIRKVEWNAKYRRIMIHAHKGFGLGMTLLRETVDQDAEYFLSWAAAHQIPVHSK